MKKINIMLIINLISLLTGLVFSLDFYLKINILFAIFCIVIELSSPIFTRYLDKKIGAIAKPLILIIIFISTSISLLGCISNGYNLVNENIEKQYKNIINEKWTTNNENLDQAKENLDQAKLDLNKYPSLNSYLSNLKSWENKSNKMTDWENGKKLLQNNVLEKEDYLSLLKEKNIEKHIRIKVNSNGYGEMLTKLSKLIGVKQSNIVLFLVIFMGIGLEIIIFTSSLICKKDTIVKNIVPKADKVIVSKVDKVIGQDGHDKIAKIDTLSKSGQDTKSIDNTSEEIEKLKNSIHNIWQGCGQDGQGHVYDKFDFGQDIGQGIDKNIEKISEYFISEIGNYFGREVPSRDILMDHFNVSKNKLIKIMKYINDNNLVVKEGRKLVLGNVINFDKYKKENTNG